MVVAVIVDGCEFKLACWVVAEAVESISVVTINTPLYFSFFNSSGVDVMRIIGVFRFDCLRIQKNRSLSFRLFIKIDTTGTLFLAGGLSAYPEIRLV